MNTFEMLLLIFFVVIMIITIHTVWLLKRTPGIRSPLITLFQILGLVLVVEMAVMVLQSSLTGAPAASSQAIADTMLMALLLAPLLYLMIIRPLNREIQNQTEKNESIIRDVPGAIILADEDGIIEVFNPKAEKAFGYTSREVIGKNVTILMPEPYLSEHDGYIRRYRETGIKHVIDKGPWEAVGRRKDGSLFPIEISASTAAINGKKLYLGVIEDISGRKDAEKTLVESNKRFQQFFYLNPEPCVITKPNGVILFANQAMYDFSGYSESDVISKTVIDLNVWVDISEREVMIQKLQKDGVVKNTEMRFRTRSGDIKSVIFAAHIFDIGGESVILSIFYDITERKKSEEKLEKSNEKFKNFFYLNPEACAITTPEGEFIEVNKAFCSLAGYTETELIGKTSVELNIWQQAEARMQYMGELTSKGYVTDKETTIKTKPGNLLDVMYTTQLIDVDGKTRLLSMVKDVTGRRKAEEKIASLASIVENTSDFVAMGDLAGNVTYYNKAARKMLGISEHEDITGIRIVDTHPARIIPLIMETAVPAALRDGLWSGETWILARDGSEIPVSQVVIANKDKSGKPLFMSTIIRDISEYKQIGEIMKLAQEAAESANRSKSEFLANMSHEIRTPLNAILGIADLLSESDINAEQEQYVSIFKKSGEHLLELINDVLDLSKIEAGHMEIEQADFNLVKVVEKAEDITAMRIHGKDIELSFHIEPDVPVYLAGDAGRIGQILINLIGNAIKFTNEGEVALDIKKYSDIADDRAELLFCVRDTGIGIPADKVESIFQSFTQADSSTTRKYGGTGLGLSISKKLVALMGGRIWVESEPGVGSRFYFTLNLGVSSQSSVFDEQNRSDLQGVKALIVDDNSTNRLILREILTSWGAEITEADNGISALRELHNARQRRSPFQLVLLDYHMPVMDGFEVARRIQEEENEYFKTTVMMVASDNKKGYIAKSKEVGIMSYLVKPVKKAELIEAINRALAAGRPVAAQPEEVITGSIPETKLTKKILLVDDAEDNRQLIQFYLKKLPYHVDLAENGEIAVDKIKSGDYDLVLMDIQMPVMDGYTATRIIRRWESELEFSPLPIVALTANAFKEDEEKSYAAGCTAHLTKPIKKALLINIVEHYVK